MRPILPARLLAFIVLLAAAPAIAHAQNAARDEGDRLIAAAGAGGVFVNETEPGDDVAIRLRHLPSGLSCTFNPGKPVNALQLFPTAPRGDDVGCTSQTITDLRTQYITRSDATNAQELKAAVDALRARHPKAKLHKPRPAPPSPFDAVAPKYETAVFLVDDRSERITVGKVGDWVLKFRFTAPAQLADAPGMLNMFWVTTALEPQLAARRAAREAAPAAPSSADEAPSEEHTAPTQ